MLHPVGSYPPSVYWRRRVALIGSVVVLVALTAWVLHGTGSGGAHTAAHTNSASTTPTPTPTPTPTTSTPASSPAGTPTRSALTTPAGSASAGSRAGVAGSSASAASSAAAPLPCQSGQLTVAAVAGASSYHVGDQPVLLMQVTDNSASACVQNLADSQVELRVYNGESRVWGSHDCQIEPGVMDQTLAPHQPVRVSVVWSGLSSQPNCAGTRQRVGAGTYTLYALLAGHVGTAAQFSIS